MIIIFLEISGEKVGLPNWFDARQSYAETISVTSAMFFLRDIIICLVPVMLYF